jgi:hypothetical protein
MVRNSLFSAPAFEDFETPEMNKALEELYVSIKGDTIF